MNFPQLADNYPNNLHFVSQFILRVPGCFVQTISWAHCTPFWEFIPFFCLPTDSGVVFILFSVANFAGSGNPIVLRR